jgi:hypothetical protein
MNVNSFLGTPLVQLLDDGRSIKLAAPFSFADTEGIYTAPTGFISNGANNPRILWPLIGSPLVGKHRWAAIIHDWLCTEKKLPWQRVHKIYYSACIIAGVNETLAKDYYIALMAFGPRWDKNGNPLKTVEPDYIPF